MLHRKIQVAVVTGPTGAIGTALCADLAAQGIRVIAVCRPGSARANKVPNSPLIRTVFCELGELGHLPELIGEKADAFFHFAWAHTIGPGRNDMTPQIQNIQYTIDAVRSAHQLGCRVFIGAGSQAEYGRVEGVLTAQTPCNPENGYGIAKLCAGHMSRIEAQSLGMDHIWARILSVYGPGDGALTMITGTIRQLLNGEEPALTAGIQAWDYLYSGDAAAAFRLMAQHGVNGKTYVLGGGKAQPLRVYVEQLRDAIDPALPLGFGKVPYGPLQVMHLEADISELQADVGFVPQISFREGICATIAYQKENQAK